jgi:F-type H+-transporting ATPase subunit b
LLAFAGLLLVAPQWALGAGGEGGGSPFAGDLGVALWTLVIFGLVVFVLGKFAWGPLLGALQGREKFIHESLAEARSEREAAAAQLAEVEERLANARAEASEILEEGQKAAIRLRAELEEKARQEAESMVSRARQEIQLARESAVKDLYTRSAGLVTELTERVVRRELTTADHERLIAEAVEELGRFEN